MIAHAEIRATLPHCRRKVNVYRDGEVEFMEFTKEGYNLIFKTEKLQCGGFLEGQQLGLQFAEKGRVAMPIN